MIVRFCTVCYSFFFFLFSTLLIGSCEKKAPLQCYLNVTVVSVGAMAILCGASTGLPLLSCHHHMLPEADCSGQDFLHSMVLVPSCFVIGGRLVSLGHCLLFYLELIFVLYC